MNQQSRSKFHALRYKIYNVSGFSLAEILIVIGVLAILLGIVIASLNISKNKKNAQNVQRQTDVNSMQKALTLRDFESNSDLDFTSLADDINTFKCIGKSASCYNLSQYLVPNYLGSIPKEPIGGTDDDTGYTISINKTTGVICIKAPNSTAGEIKNCRQ